MDLSPEDELRINVLLANKPLAIRIDESCMQIFALTQTGTANIQLNPTDREQHYLKQVRELLSMHALGNPVGYPVHLQRWTRMGQVQNYNLDALLCLGEPEAVLAVVYSSQLSLDLAERAWWAIEDAENARQLLRSKVVAGSELGRRLVDYLLEYLPFETEAESIVDSVQLILQSGLANAAEISDLWKKSRRKQVISIGFLAAGADYIPEKPKSLHPLFEKHQHKICYMADLGDPAAQTLAFLLSASGQAWLVCLRDILDKPGNQQQVNRTLDVVGERLSALRSDGRVDAEIAGLLAEAADWVESIDQQMHEFKPQLAAARVLSGLGYGVVRPVFSKSDAVGTLMRQKLKPILEQVICQVDILIG